MGNESSFKKKSKLMESVHEVRRPSPTEHEKPYLGKHTSFNNKFSLVICRNAAGQFLAVKETGIRGWWIPGGRVDRKEDFIQAAHRASIEEAGIEVNLVGVIRFEHSVQKNGE